jgi:hypothetical protein
MSNTTDVLDQSTVETQSAVSDAIDDSAAVAGSPVADATFGSQAITDLKNADATDTVANFSQENATLKVQKAVNTLNKGKDTVPLKEDGVLGDITSGAVDFLKSGIVSKAHAGTQSDAAILAAKKPPTTLETQKELNTRTGSKLDEDGISGKMTDNAVAYDESKPNKDSDMTQYATSKPNDTVLERGKKGNFEPINRRLDSRFSKEGVEKAWDIQDQLQKGGFPKDNIHFASGTRDTKAEMQDSVDNIKKDKSYTTYNKAKYGTLIDNYQKAKTQADKDIAEEAIYQQYLKAVKADPDKAGHYDSKAVDLVGKTPGDEKGLVAKLAYLKKLNDPNMTVIGEIYKTDSNGKPTKVLKSNPHIHIQWK